MTAIAPSLYTEKDATLLSPGMAGGFYMPDFPWTKLPFKEAIAYFQAKENIDTDGWRDVLDLEHDVGFAVAGAKGALLNDLRQAVELAIAAGTSLQEFQKAFDQTVAARGWSYSGDRDWRSNLIYQTNLRAAYGRGREEQIQRVKTRRPYAQWRHGGSRDPRPEHLASDGRVYPVDERPTALPHGYGCRCVWFTLSQGDMDRLGLELSDRLPVPEEPGWSQELGVRTAEQKAALLEQVTARLHPAIAAQVKQEVAGG
jgi:uncharacterized protein with gpF-like domain